MAYLGLRAIKRLWGNERGLGMSESAEERKRKQLDKMSQRLHELRAQRKDKPVFSYLEYLEFSGPEFKKFKDMPTVTNDDLRNLDMDELLKKFADYCSAPELGDSQ